jgi:outer membrane lipoprotein carrier protein
MARRLALFRLLCLILASGCLGLDLGLDAQQAAAPSRPGAEAFARALQQRYEAVKDFSADFTQTYRGGVLRTTTSERGTVQIKKPGMMRWRYTNPEPKEFVSDGRTMFSYIPADRQVFVSSVPPDNQASSAVLFLAGKGNLVRDFVPTFVEGGPAGAQTLRLTPRRAEAEYEYLVIVSDPRTFAILGLTTRDHQGGESALIFAKLKENQGISDREFVFRIPRGVDVSNGTRN